MKLFKLLVFILVVFSLVASSCTKECDCCPPQTETKTLTTQPGPNDGQDCLVIYRETDGNLAANSNNNLNPDFVASRWSYNAEGAGNGTSRAYIKFPDVSTISSAAVVKSAKLSLYGRPTGAAITHGNSYYPGSPFASFGDNACWLKLVTGDWDETTIKWTNKPSTTDANQVEVPFSTSQFNFDVIDLDVTKLVKEMVVSGQNYGFCLQLKTEELYRSLMFSTSENTEASKRPKLVVVYEE